MTDRPVGGRPGGDRPARRSLPSGSRTRSRAGSRACCAMNLAWGPTPVPEALEATSRRSSRACATTLAPSRSCSAATPTCSPRPETSSRRASRARPDARRSPSARASGSCSGGRGGRTSAARELLAGDPERAERALRPSYRRAARGGQPRVLVDARRAARARARRARTPGRGRGASPRSRATRPERPTFCRRFSGGAPSPGRSPSRATRRRSRDLGDEAVRLAATTEWPNVLADALLDRAASCSARSAPTGRCATRTSSGREWYISPSANTAGYAKATILASGPTAARASHDRARRAHGERRANTGCAAEGRGRHALLHPEDRSLGVRRDGRARAAPGRRRRRRRTCRACTRSRCSASPAGRTPPTRRCRRAGRMPPMPEAGSRTETAAFMPMPEGASEPSSADARGGARRRQS